MPSAAAHSERHVVVIGGGISGLAAAYRLSTATPAPRVTLLEADQRLGGVLQTECQDGFCGDWAADQFVTDLPWGIDLCRRIGLVDQLQPTDPNHRKAFVVHRGRLQDIPEGFLLMAPRRLGPLLRTPLLSWRGKLRLACEPFIPRRDIADENHDESIASFARRRLGRETFQRLVQPLIGGIYTGDPERLSLRATLPRFLEMEARHGSLLRAARAANSAEVDDRGARYSLFVAPQGGMHRLVDAIAARLPQDTVRLDSPVERIKRQGDRWHVAIGRPVDTTAPPITADALILATPAPVAARLLRSVAAEAAEILAQIVCADCTVVLAGYLRRQFTHPLDGFGFVVPEIEGRSILAVSFSSVKFPGRAPPDHALLRVFIGGACHPELNGLPEDKLHDLVATELGELLGLSGPPVYWRTVHWREKMPQYHLGHARRVSELRRVIATLPGLTLAGNAYDGVGIPWCIRSGEQAADAILAQAATA